MKRSFGIVALAFVIIAQVFTQAANAEPVSSVAGLPQTPLLGPPLAVAPYNPPAINSPSDSIMQSNQSFQLNEGLGNNPTNRDTYVREHLND
jgi:hypothetical protein